MMRDCCFHGQQFRLIKSEKFEQIVISCESMEDGRTDAGGRCAEALVNLVWGLCHCWLV